MSDNIKKRLNLIIKNSQKKPDLPDEEFLPDNSSEYHKSPTVPMDEKLERLKESVDEHINDIRRSSLESATEIDKLSKSLIDYEELSTRTIIRENEILNKMNDQVDKLDIIGRDLQNISYSSGSDIKDSLLRNFDKLDRIDSNVTFISRNQDEEITILRGIRDIFSEIEDGSFDSANDNGSSDNNYDEGYDDYDEDDDAFEELENNISFIKESQENIQNNINSLKEGQEKGLSIISSFGKEDQSYGFSEDTLKQLEEMINERAKKTEETVHEEVVHCYRNIQTLLEEKEQENEDFANNFGGIEKNLKLIKILIIANFIIVVAFTFVLCYLLYNNFMTPVG